MSSIDISLSQLVDLAVGSPEAGVVNFNILHTLLHSLVKSCQIEDIIIGIHGVEPHSIESEPLLGAESNNKEIIVDEYEIHDGRRIPKKILVRKHPLSDLQQLITLSKNIVRFRAAGDDDGNYEADGEPADEKALSEVAPMEAATSQILDKTKQIEENTQKIEVLNVSVAKLQDDVKQSSTKANRITTIVENLEQQIASEVKDSRIAIDTSNQVGGKIEHLQENINELTKRVWELEAKSKNLGATSVTSVNPAASAAMNAKIASIEERLNDVESQFEVITGDLNRHLDRLNRLHSTTEELSLNKIDREEIDELLADKADYSTLQRKVSVEYFDEKKYEVDNTVAQLLENIRAIEQIISSTAEDIQSKIDNKIDSEKLENLKNYVDGRFQAMRKQLSTMPHGSMESEAAGTKFLRNVECVSCNNRHVKMRREEDNRLPKLESLCPEKSIRPYLTYDLDNIRKEISKLSYSRNMNHFSDMNRIIDSKAKNLCLRYCGGSHTVVTPENRGVGRKQGGRMGSNDMDVKCKCEGMFKKEDGHRSA